MKILLFLLAGAGCLWSLTAMASGTRAAPRGLTVELLGRPGLTVIADPAPEFGWIVPSVETDDAQVAYRVLVASSLEKLEKDQVDLWDSGKVNEAVSVNVEYRGKPLSPGQGCCWKVKTWCRHVGESAWSEPQSFRMAQDLKDYATSRYPLQRSEIEPVAVIKRADGRVFVDFGKVAFGYLVLELDSPVDNHPLVVHFGERGDEHGVNKEPGATVRYHKVTTALKRGEQRYEVHPPRDARNTGGAAIRLPPEIGDIAPFRFVELENGPVDWASGRVRQIAVHYPFDEDASSFTSSSEVLNDVWDLCKYSMKATSFCGVYVDGDRERIPYEADAYINQLSHYAVDREYSLARYSHEYLMTHPTWPTEWKQHSVLMAWADYMYTGNAESVGHYYEMLQSRKTLENRAREDGLLNTRGMRDIVDWPQGERDGYEFKEVNTVVNAFYYRTLVLMSDLAEALGKTGDVAMYHEKAELVKDVFNSKLFDPGRGIYVDGEGSAHASLHANMFPLAFDLVPPERMEKVADFIVSRGMACSVYGAQYVLEALYKANRPDAALALMTSQDIRSWYNMLRVGSTITLEAWDNRFKPNQDWNHAWGAAPGNIISRYLLGVQPLEAGFAQALIRPMPGGLEEATGVAPTIRGPVRVSLSNKAGEPFRLDLILPANMTARVEIPATAGRNKLVVDGQTVKADILNGFAVVKEVGAGSHRIERYVE